MSIDSVFIIGLVAGFLTYLSVDETGDTAPKWWTAWKIYMVNMVGRKPLWCHFCMSFWWALLGWITYIAIFYDVSFQYSAWYKLAYIVVLDAFASAAISYLFCRVIQRLETWFIGGKS